MTDRETDLLAQFRAHPRYASIVGNIVVDLIDGLDDSEEYDGESDAHREAYQLLHELLTGARYEMPVYDSAEVDVPEHCVLCGRPLSLFEAAQAAGACIGCVVRESEP
jgi:hypothetical protein